MMPSGMPLTSPKSRRGNSRPKSKGRGKDRCAQFLGRLGSVPGARGRPCCSSAGPAATSQERTADAYASAGVCPLGPSGLKTEDEGRGPCA